MSGTSNQAEPRRPQKELTTSAAVAAVSGATYISLAIGLLRGILYTSVLTPTSRGIVQIVFLFGKYLSYSHLGITHGLTKRVPTLLGEGEDERVEHLETVGLTAIFVLAVAAGAVMWGYAALASGIGVVTRFAIAIGGVHLIVGQLVGAFRVILRGHHHFGLIARATIVEGVLLFALVVAGSQLLDAPGTMVGWALGLSVMCLYFLSFRLVPGTPRVDMAATRTLVKVGLPVLGVGLAESWMRNADTVVVAKLLGAQALGYYGLAWQLSSYLYNVPASAGFVIMPKILRTYGEGGPEAARRSVLDMTRALSILMPPLAGAATLAGPLLVRLVLTRYVPAIPPLRVLLMATVFLAVPTALRTTLIAENRERVLVFWQALAGLVSCTAVAWFVSRQAPLVHLAMGAGAGWLFGGTAVAWFGLRSLGLTPAGAATYLLSLVAPFVYCAGALWGLRALADQWPGAPSEVVCEILSLPVFAVLVAPLVWYAERKTGIFTKIRGRGRPPTPGQEPEAGPPDEGDMTP